MGDTSYKYLQCVLVCAVFFNLQYAIVVAPEDVLDRRKVKAVSNPEAISMFLVLLDKVSVNS